MNKTLIRNRARCLVCGVFVESNFTNEYVSCQCGNVSIDGGLTEAKRTVQDSTKFEELAEYEEAPA